MGWLARLMARKAALLGEVARPAAPAASAEPQKHLSAADRIAAAQALNATGDPEGALELLDLALANDAHEAAALRGRGLVLLKLGRFDEALASLEAALAAGGPAPDGYTALAGALQRLGRLDDALAAVRSALELRADHAGALCAGVGILVDQLRVREALEMGRHALQLHPQNADLHWNTGIAHLLLGQLKEGFAEHEWRWRSSLMRSSANRPAYGARWAGEDLAGKTILLRAEQGFGDTLQYLRFVPAIAARAKAVLLDVPAPLEPLLQDLAPHVTLLHGDEDLPRVDFQADLMSLPHAMGVTLDTLPAPVPYLRADPGRVQAWRQRLGDGSGRKLAGLVWSGNAAHANDRNRSIPLAQLRGIEANGWRFVSLQPQVRASDEAALRDWPQLVPAGPQLRDFAETAALVECLDLVISVDTSVAHLAGALGRPVWVLLPHAPDWRWMTGREDSPWYPTATLYRQLAPGRWDSVVSRVKRGLESLADRDAAAGAAAPNVDWKARGNAALGEWNLAEAERCYREALAQSSTDGVAHLNLGFVLLEQGRAVEAMPHLRQAVADGGVAHDAHFLLGRAQAAQGRIDEALAEFEAAVAAKPDFAEVCEEAARVAHGAERFEAMLRWAQRLRALKPTADAQLVVAQALQALKRPGEALAEIEAVLAHEPAKAGAWAGRGAVLLDCGRAEEAVDAADRALSLGGPDPEILLQRASALTRLGRHDAALRDIDQALALRPGDTRALAARGAVLLAAVRVEDAVRAADEGLALHPQDADLHWNHAVGSLLLGDYQAGWKHYEYRWFAAAFGRGGEPPRYGRPRWSGVESLHGKTVLVDAEQGLGDTIQFLRFVPMLAARAGTVLLRAPQLLAPLLAGIAPNCRVVHDGAGVPPFDFTCPLMSLPHVLGITLDNLPAPVPRLKVDEVRVQAWRERLALSGPGPFVGLSWSGNASYNNDHHRSIPLAQFRALEAAGCRFVAVQSQVRASDGAALGQWPSLLRFDEAIAPFAEAAALVAALDLVVTVDTVFAHLAGALGRPVWVLEPYSPDWRWMLDREDSPWYPTARLFRQPAEGDWHSTLARVRGELTAWAAAAITPVRTAPAAAEWRSRGNAALNEGNLDVAAQCYSRSILADSADASAHLNLGFVLLEQQQPESAESSLMQALTLLNPSDALACDAHYFLARARRAGGKAAGALVALDAALAARADFPEALEEKVALLLEFDRPAEALEASRRLSTVRPGAAAALLAARALHALGRHEDALQPLDAVLAEDPDNLSALEGRANVLLALWRADEALPLLDRVLAVQGANPDTLSNASAALIQLGRIPEALDRANAALVLHPGHRNALYNKSHLLRENLQVRESLELASEALRVHPGDPDLQWNCAVAHLLLGEFAPGWRAHEARWRAPCLGQREPVPMLARAAWSGESLAGRSIALYSEQGFGDTIQFLRHVQAVKQAAARVVVQVQPALVAVASASLPGCEVVASGAVFPLLDFQCALMSLPFALGLDDERKLAALEPYVAVDPVKGERWRRRLSEGDARPIVGLAWSGNSRHRNDHNRSIALELLRPLASAGARLVSIQREVRPVDLRCMEVWPELLACGEELRDFADTAALLNALDVVITVDTSVAHLAGALGRPVWLLLPHCPDWRWMLDRSDSPLYPQMRLYRQGTPGAWGEVIKRVRDDLAALPRRREGG